MIQAAERGRAGVRAARDEWATAAPGLDPERLVFVDETWVKSNMTPAYGWGPTSGRVVEAVPHGHWKTTTFVAALRASGVVAPMVVDGAITGDLFVAYVEQVLVKELTAGDVVVMDNLACHKVAKVAPAIEKAGARVVYLPAYSPDLNPIEQVFAKAKGEIRRRKPRTVADTETWCGDALDRFPPAECRNDIRHGGYGPQGSN